MPAGKIWEWEWDLSFIWEWKWDGNGNEVNEVEGNWDDKSVPVHLQCICHQYASLQGACGRPRFGIVKQDGPRYIPISVIVSTAVQGWKSLGLQKKFLGFQVLMYEDQTQNYDLEIHEEYLIHDTPIPLPHRYKQS